MLVKDMKYSYNDITIVPAPITTVEHRADCNPYLSNGLLPIFTAPMSSVVNEENFDLFEANKINAILPRSYSFDKRKEFAIKGKWAAFSLQEFENNFVNKFDNEVAPKVLIDIANGHMQKLYDLVRQSKDNWGDKNIVIMIGNIANPLTYKEVVDCGADFVRVSVGAGMGCFVNGTKVLTTMGEKNIEDVVVGDVVITHKMREREVINTISYKTNKNEILEINKEIKCTKNHKFLVINKSDADKVNDDNILDYAFWVEAQKLDKEQHFLIKKV